jgi:hypothetical protein
MKKELIVRVDDACPTMASAPWREIESIFDELEIKPIVGVIPDCQDPELNLDACDDGFWQRVQSWERKGWTIAMHGHKHSMYNCSKRTRALVPFHRRSEFAGLPLIAQRKMLRTSYEAFSTRNLKPQMFMAPAHSFDRTTLEALALETPIKWITDGISYRAFERFGINWLPQQLGRIPPLLPIGCWTLCLHPSSMSRSQIVELAEGLRVNKPFTRPAPIHIEKLPKYGLTDGLFEMTYWTLRAMKGLYREPTSRQNELSN